MTPIYLMPLCDCADHGMHCRGRQDGKACMSRDPWWKTPCREGKCPGLLHPHCCGRGPDVHDDGGLDE